MYACTCKALNRYTSTKLNSFTANAYDYGNVENRTKTLASYFTNYFCSPKCLASVSPGRRFSWDVTMDVIFFWFYFLSLHFHNKNPKFITNNVYVAFEGNYKRKFSKCCICFALNIPYPWQIKINVLWMAIIITNEHKMTQQLLVIK